MTKRALQGELNLKPRTWGGAREGAGRKKKPRKNDPLHRVRTDLRGYHPVHVVTRVNQDVPRLRQPAAYRAIHCCLGRCIGWSGFQVCHVSIQANHLHLLVEAEGKEALSTGMQRLNITMSRALNRELGRSGSVFQFRYHATPIKTPRQARHALAYVLNNWRRHREDESSERARWAHLDPFASGLSFDGWTGPGYTVPDGVSPLPVSKPSSWLLRTGWKKHGLIDAHEVPGPGEFSTRAAVAQHPRATTVDSRP